MKEYFDIAGDHMPNSKEIHIENSPLIDLYKIYKKDVILQWLSYTQWLSMWTTLFPHVKMREFKQVLS